MSVHVRSETLALREAARSRPHIRHPVPEQRHLQFYLPASTHLHLVARETCSIRCTRSICSNNLRTAPLGSALSHAGLCPGSRHESLLAVKSYRRFKSSYTTRTASLDRTQLQLDPDQLKVEDQTHPDSANATLPLPQADRGINSQQEPDTLVPSPPWRQTTRPWLVRSLTAPHSSLYLDGRVSSGNHSNRMVPSKVSSTMAHHSRLWKRKSSTYGETTSFAMRR